MIRASTHLFIALIAGGLFLAALAVPVFLYVHIARAGAYVEQVQGEILNEARQERVDALTTQALLNTEVERARLDELALHEDDVAGFIGSIERDARVAGVKLEVGSVMVTPKDAVFGTFTLSLQATGTFGDVTLLLKLIETSPFASAVGSVALEKKDDKSALWTLTLTLTAPIHTQR